MPEASILVVDDEEYIRDLVSSGLRLAGFEAHAAAGGHEALATIAASPPDLVVLDVAMPELDGHEVCRQMRAAGDHTPVIFLTARGAVADRVSGFALGADDYVVKPFNLEELAARVRAVLRRGEAGDPLVRALRYADLELHEDGVRVTRAGRAVQLSPTELRLLRYLLVNQERVVSRTQIMDAVWDDTVDGSSGIVENYISYLRKKIDDADRPLIHTVRGFGYVLRSEP